MSVIVQFLCVGIGGGLGAMARFGVGLALYHAVERPWIPWATVAVNLLGCFLIGIGAHYIESRTSGGDLFRTLAMVGFLGGFTTFSTFGIETFQLIRTGHTSGAAAYVLSQLILGVALAGLGYWIGSGLFRQA